MSKASEWAAMVLAMQPDFKLVDLKAELTDEGNLMLRAVSVDGILEVKAEEALSLGRWLVETFGEGEAQPQRRGRH